MGEAEGDITVAPADLTVFDTTQIAVGKALQQAGLKIDDYLRVRNSRLFYHFSTSLS